jgi:hypothetical protein
VYSGIIGAGFSWFFSMPAVWSALFGIPLVLTLAAVPFRWLARQ